MRNESDNKVVDLLLKRLATRSFKDDSVSSSLIEELTEAVRLTPSCYNNQPWRFLFLQSAEARNKGIETLVAGNQAWAKRAPLLVIGYSDKKNDCQVSGRDYHQFDLGMSVMNLMLAATQRGLVARPMAGFHADQIQKIFGLEADEEPMVVVAIGYPSFDEDHLPDHFRGLSHQDRERKNTSEIVQIQ